MSDSEIEENRYYLIKHRCSASEAQVRCYLDKNKKAKLISVQLLTGKVISLQHIKDVLSKIKQDYGSDSSADELA